MAGRQTGEAYRTMGKVQDMRYLVIIALIASVIGCDRNPGPDSITSHTIGAFGDCADCHLSPGNIAPDPLITNGSGTAGKHVAHVASLGLVCTKCHFNYTAHSEHSNGIVNSKGNFPSPVYFDAANPTGVWSYVTPSGPGTCTNTVCHKSQTPDWYGLAVPPQDPVCSNCHNASIGARRQIVDTGGDFASNPSTTSHHVAQAIDPTSTQCTVCHDQSLHMGGVVRLRNADTGNRIDYDPFAPSSLEPFCLSCHDADGALVTAATGSALSPFADGQTLGTMPYNASTTIASSWTGSSAHRSRGVTCAGTGTPNTGCHGRSGVINAHGSVNKGLLTNAMNFQIPLVTYSVYTANPLGSSFSYNNYKLCFDCHASYPAVTKEVVLGYRAGGVYDKLKARTPYYTIGMQSLFRERYIGIDPVRPYSDTMFDDAYLALHNYHLIGFEVDTFALPPNEVNMLQWKYRGDPSRVGRITCTACHNVHGTASVTIRSTYPELGLQRDYAFWTGFIPLPGESYTSIDPDIDAAIMTSFPMNCAIDCHGKQGQSSYWHTPNGE